MKLKRPANKRAAFSCLLDYRGTVTVEIGIRAVRFLVTLSSLVPSAYSHSV